MFQHTAARRRLVFHCFDAFGFLLVSTHSRPKAAGCASSTIRTAPSGFNTQPPEGGWNFERDNDVFCFVSTHSRPKAAGRTSWHATKWASLFQHTAARRRLGMAQQKELPWVAVSTHSRPKAAGSRPYLTLCVFVCFNTQPPEGGWQGYTVGYAEYTGFQHTAARRRLGFDYQPMKADKAVSTHSRPKAAGQYIYI